MNYYILLAKSAVENYIKEGKIISPQKDLPKEFFEKKSGVFVTIEKDGKLKGCIGTYLPTRENIAKEIIVNAIAAATEDYRFEPVKEPELSSLSYTVSVLSRPEQVLIKKASDSQKVFFERLKQAGLNPKKYGIIIRSFFIESFEKINKAGLLLPDLKGVDTIKKQISITCQKAGIDPSKENIIIYKFTVKKHY